MLYHPPEKVSVHFLWFLQIWAPILTFTACNSSIYQYLWIVHRLCTLPNWGLLLNQAVGGLVIYVMSWCYCHIVLLELEFLDTGNAVNISKMLLTLFVCLCTKCVSDCESGEWYQWTFLFLPAPILPHMKPTVSLM